MSGKLATVFAANSGKAERKCQTACKPGSVPAKSRGMVIHLGRPLPDASRDLPGRRRGNPLVPAETGSRAAPIRSCSRWGLPCHLRYRRRGALLPHPFTLTRGRKTRSRRAVCFLWHCPWGRPRRPLAGTVFPWSPDFPPPALEARKATIRPSGEAHPRGSEAAAQWGKTKSGEPFDSPPPFTPT